MNIKTLSGIVLLAVAAVLLYSGYIASQGAGGQGYQTFTGDAAIWYFVFGIVSAIGGFMMVAFKAYGDPHDLTDLRRTHVGTHNLGRR